jgi:flagellar FliL protein
MTMSEETPSKPPAPKGASPILLIAIVVGALVAGGAVGGFLVGPRLVAARPAPKAEGDQAEEKGKDEGKDSEGQDKAGKGGGDKPAYYQLDNIIVNPAGSQGTRFLMASIAIEMTDPKLDERLKAKEVELRDIVISTLERQTMDQLNRPGARDSVRAQLAARIQPLAGTRRPIHVFLPQFVVQ